MIVNILYIYIGKNSWERAYKGDPKNLIPITVFELIKEYPESVDSFVVFQELIRVFWEGIDV